MKIDIRGKIEITVRVVEINGRSVLLELSSLDEPQQVTVLVGDSTMLSQEWSGTIGDVETSH